MTSTDSEQPEKVAPPREMGEQPLAGLMREHGLSNHDLVAAAAIRATGQSATLTDLFYY